MLTPEQARRLAVEVFSRADDEAGDVPLGGHGGERASDAAVERDWATAPGGGDHSCLPADDLPRLPERLGPYRIIGLIGQGGMGAVYHAQRDDPHLVAAIKVIKRGMVARRDLHHLYEEAEILGSLHHPGIAQIHDAGTFDDDGCGRVPYFVMEYIPNARSITRYAREHDLTTRQRLELFARACDAVHYGHQKGIIHRDLKPANILIGEESLGPLPPEEEGPGVRVRTDDDRVDRFTPPENLPQPKIIDFGVATSTNADITLATLHSSVRELVGTLQYMSPEQCEGNPRNVTALSDIYSLGVVLYQLICGRLPYDVSDHSIASAALAIRQAQPPLPGAISRHVRGNIEAIILKAMAKEPAKRYTSAAEFAQDIRRHLRGEPVDARTPTKWLKAMRWVARHPIASTAAACLMIAVSTLALTSIAVWYYNELPNRIVVSEDRSEVQLIARSGREIANWDTEITRGVVDATFVGHSIGADQLTVIAFSQRQRKLWPGQVCLYDVGSDMDEPIRRIHLLETDLLPEHHAREMTPQEFDIGWYRMMDVFSDSTSVATPEIVVNYQHVNSSASAICIYDMGGALLYRVWHDGNLQAPYWMPAGGHLVMAALNSKVYLEDRGVDSTQEGHPTVIFGIRPLLGYIERTDYLSEAPGSGPADPAWYWQLMPSDSSDWIRDLIVAAPRGRYDPGSQVELTIVPEGHPDCSLNFIIDSSGREVPGSRVINDEWSRQYRRDPTSLPSPDDVKLGSLPPMQGRDSNR